jgi:hypothetical protein
MRQSMSSQHVTTLLRRASTIGAVVVTACSIATAPAAAAPAPTLTAMSTSAIVICHYKVLVEYTPHRTSPKRLSNNVLGDYVEGQVLPARRDVVVNGFRQLRYRGWVSSVHIALVKELPCSEPKSTGKGITRKF